MCYTCTVHVFQFLNRNFRVLPTKSLFANIWIHEVAGKCIENIKVDLRMSKIKPIHEMLNSRHNNLAKYSENITSRIISMFRVCVLVSSAFLFLSCIISHFKVHDSLPEQLSNCFSNTSIKVLSWSWKKNLYFNYA